MSRTETSYRQIFKATSLFGGVQIVNIIITVIRSKVVALLLGPAGMGIFGLFTTATNLIKEGTGLGLATSAVRTVAEVHAKENDKELGVIIAVLKKIIWLTALLGALIVLLAAPLISELTFGNRNYTVAFYWLSLSVIANQLTVGQNIQLQGMQKLSLMAKANMLGAFLSLLFSIPLYYFFRLDGIAPAIIITSICTFFIAFYYSRKLSVHRYWVSFRQAWSSGKNMVKTGIYISISSFSFLAQSYLTNIYINHTGSIDDVGLYNAGFAIVGVYVNMIFTAMSTDYYPRLSAVAVDSAKSNDLINQQAEVMLLILSPILIIFLIFAEWGILILYSQKFLPITTMVLWMALGMYFRAICWTLMYLLFAKGRFRLFFYNEMAYILYFFAFNLLGYKYWGLVGLGISFLVAQILYAIQSLVITQFHFSFKPSKQVMNVFVIQILFGIMAFFLSKELHGLWRYIIGVMLVIVNVALSLKELEKRVDISGFIREKVFISRNKK